MKKTQQETIVSFLIRDGRYLSYDEIRKATGISNQRISEILRKRQVNSNIKRKKQIRRGATSFYKNKMAIHVKYISEDSDLGNSYKVNHNYKKINQILTHAKKRISTILGKKCELELLIEDEKKTVEYSLIRDVCCGFFGVEKIDLLGKRRKREMVECRQYISYLTRQYTTLSLTNIGYKLNRDHSTIIHSVKTIEDELNTDYKARIKIKKIREQLETSLKKVDTYNMITYTSMQDD